MRDAETGQQWLLAGGEERYLDPYNESRLVRHALPTGALAQLPVFNGPWLGGTLLPNDGALVLVTNVGSAAFHPSATGAGGVSLPAPPLHEGAAREVLAREARALFG